MTHIDQQEPSTAGDKVEVAQKEYSLEPHSHQEPSTLNVGEQLMEVISLSKKKGRTRFGSLVKVIQN